MNVAPGDYVSVKNVQWIWICVGLIALIIQADFLTVPYLIPTCILATFAAIQEGHLIRTEGR